MFELNCVGNGPVKSTAKKKFIRKMLVDCPDGSKEVVTVHANNLESLSGEGQMLIPVRSSSDFFFAVE